MKSLLQLQLALWRGACRHVHIADAIDDLHEAIATATPVRNTWILSISGGRCTLEASCPHDGREFSVVGAETERLAHFAAKGGLSTLDPVRPGRSLLRSLAAWFAAASGGGRLVCGGLQRDGQAEGIVVWTIAGSGEPGERASATLAHTLEPLASALDTSRRFHELESLRLAAEADRGAALRRLGRQSLSEDIIGARGGLAPILERVQAVAPQDVPVLILGETGSGKEVIARAIHERSPRRDGPFVRVNCGAIPPDLIDAQLFGHEKGAFTGAADRRLGWFERADGGTLLLDEIGELPPAAQVRLLRVAQEHTLERVGGQEPVHVDCRIVAATHRDLAAMVRERTFREDLWYRLAVFPILLPPLRERPQDLPELARHLSDRASLRFGLPAFQLDDDDLELLRAYPWPGNIRELGAVIDRAALLGRGDRLALAAAMGSDAPNAPARTPSDLDASNKRPGSVYTLSEATTLAIRAALQASAGKVDGPGGAADLLGINASTLRSKMHKLGLAAATFRHPCA